MSDKIYLDCASTTKPSFESLDTAISFLKDKWYNPSSLYNDAANIKKEMKFAYKSIAEFIGCDFGNIYFTSCGSESNCMALQGFALNRISNGFTPCIITTKIEHKSILKCADAMSRLNCVVYYLDVDDKGFIDIDELDIVLRNMSEELGGNNILISIQYANNEIGTVQDVKTIAETVHEYGAVFHTDAVQAFCHMPIDVNQLGIDMMSVSGHKFNCFKGTGFLYKKESVEINPIIYGSQNFGMRGGTENTAGIISMARAIDKHRCCVAEKYIDCTVAKRDCFIEKLEKIGCVLNGDETNRLPNNINIMLPEGVNGESMLYMLDLSNIMVSTGSACNSNSVEQSHVLKAIGLSDEEAMRCIRITIPDNITSEEIDKVVCEIKKNIRLIKSTSLGK